MYKSCLTILMLIALFSLPFAAVQAQDEKPTDQPVYYIAADAVGVQQVYQHLIDGESEPRQLTHAASDIINFGVAYDGLSIAYLTSDRLWLQPIHTEEAEALAAITTTKYLSAPVYSQDGHFIAYTNNGVWLLDLATRETRQIIENVPLEENGRNVDELRIYSPVSFVLGDAGKAKLIVSIGLWEGRIRGVYDLASGELQSFALGGYVHSSLLPLSDGRVLLYGSAGPLSKYALHLAENLDDINTSIKVISFSDVTDVTLWDEQAVEIAPGIVRVYGQGFNIPTAGTASNFYFDHDMNANTTSEAHFITLPEDMTQASISGPLSPDGRILPIYINATSDSMGKVAGELRLIDLATGKEVDAEFPVSVSAFSWQP